MSWQQLAEEVQMGIILKENNVRPIGLYALYCGFPHLRPEWTTVVFKGLLCVSVVVFSLSLVLIATDTMEYYAYNQNNITVEDVLGCTHTENTL